MAARLSVRKIILFALNLVSTILTLLTGLRENPVIVFVTGRYDLVRSRLVDGSVNYNNLQDGALNRGVLADLKDVGNNYRFFSAPTRSPENLAEDRSTCLRVNSMNVSMMSMNYDDFWGKGARRSQVFVFSISTPKCDLINFNPEWLAECIKNKGGSEDKCNQYIMDNFDTLSRNHLIQAGIEQDFGYPGAVFLKCKRRPHRKFEYNTDLMVHQSYWAGGSYHVELQSSLCVAEPVIRDADWEWGLFRVQPKDQTAKVVFAIENSGWFATIVSVAYGFVAITMMIQGIFAMILRVRTVRYIPSAARFLAEQRIFKVIFPFMSAALRLPHVENLVITFKGSSFMASDVWMNHWLYIGLSILDAVVNIRMGYVVLEMGTWMLGKKANPENFIFLCGALTKITWIMCLLHTLIRVGLKLTINSVRKLKVLRPKILDFFEWYVDASALFLSYKIYSVLLCLILYIMWNVHGATTFMVPQPWFKQGVFGGAPNLSQFWGNEIICDLFILLIILTACGIVVGSLLLMTTFRAVASNQVIRLMQHRYFFVGWDVFIALEALGIDPHNPELVDNGNVRTNCSLGCILQQLYTSGCSGHVNLACDSIFMQNGLSSDPPKFTYPIKRASAIGLCSSRPGGVHTSTHGASTQDTERSTKPMTVKPVVSKTGKSLFDRKLTLISEGYTGRILLIDEDEPGCVVHNSESGRNEYEVVDAISQIGIMDIKPLLGGQKKLHIR